MCRCKNGNPKKKSRFICLKCETENMIGDGIQRGKQREKFHIKDLFCLECGDVTKNVEVRYCDDYAEIMGNVDELKEEYYMEGGCGDEAD